MRGNSADTNSGYQWNLITGNDRCYKQQSLRLRCLAYVNPPWHSTARPRLSLLRHSRTEHLGTYNADAELICLHCRSQQYFDTILQHGDRERSYFCVSKLSSQESQGESSWKTITETRTYVLQCIRVGCKRCQDDHVNCSQDNTSGLYTDGALETNLASPTLQNPGDNLVPGLEQLSREDCKTA